MSASAAIFAVGFLAGCVVSQLAVFAFLWWKAARQPVDIDWNNAARR